MCRINIIMRLKDKSNNHIKRVKNNEHFELEVNLNSSDVLTDEMKSKNLGIYFINQNARICAKISEDSFVSYIDKDGKIDTVLKLNFNNLTFPEIGEYQIFAFAYDNNNKKDIDKLLNDKDSIYSVYDFSVY